MLVSPLAGTDDNNIPQFVACCKNHKHFTHTLDGVLSPDQKNEARLPGGQKRLRPTGVSGRGGPAILCGARRLQWRLILWNSGEAGLGPSKRWQHFARKDFS